MKKRLEWVRKKTKRTERKKHDKGIVEFIKIVRHFFGELNEWIEEMEDPRNESYITYSQKDFFYMGCLKNACSVESMKKMEDLFNEENCIRALGILSGNEELDEMPHCDTLNYYLSKLSPECLGEIRTKMIRKLIKSKVFNKARLSNGGWRVILDGTGLFSFKEKHCDNCLRQTTHDEDGTKHTVYYHKVLEAKLVLGDGFVVSLGTEFIENESEEVKKQDCEINAAKRLLPRIKKAFPRLKICIQADALYETEPMMHMCKSELGWDYIFTHKDTRQPAVGESFNLLEEQDMAVVKNACKEHGVAKYYNGVESLAGKKETMNMVSYQFEEEDEEGIKTLHIFTWTTSIQIKRANVEDIINAGRGRWQIENEGFNVQKNVTYKIEHLNSRNPRAMKNHYLLTQISDIIFQLYYRYNRLVKKFGQGLKNTSSRLLESFRTHSITEEDVSYINRRTSVYLE